jgi:hypothetical protein
MKELAIKLREGDVSKAGLHTRECFQVGHTGGGHDRSRDASVSEMLAAGRGTVEPPQVGGDTMISTWRVSAARYSAPRDMRAMPIMYTATVQGFPPKLPATSLL